MKALTTLALEYQLDELTGTRITLINHEQVERLQHNGWIRATSPHQTTGVVRWVPTETGASIPLLAACFT